MAGVGGHGWLVGAVCYVLWFVGVSLGWLTWVMCYALCFVVVTLGWMAWRSWWLARCGFLWFIMVVLTYYFFYFLPLVMTSVSL